VRFYDPKAVRDFSKRLTRDKSAQANQTNAVRQALSTLLERTNASVRSTPRSNQGEVHRSSGAGLRGQRGEAHNAAISSDPNLNRVLRVNIVDRLAKEYGATGTPYELRASGCVPRQHFLAMNDAEVKRSSASGIPKDQTCISHFTVIMPDAENRSSATCWPLS